MLEKRLIYEMAGLRGGKTKLAGIRTEYEAEIAKLAEAIEVIDQVTREVSDAVSTPVDSIGE